MTIMINLGRGDSVVDMAFSLLRLYINLRTRVQGMNSFI